LLFVFLLGAFLPGIGLATAVAQGDKTPDKKPVTEQAAAAAKTQKKEAVSKQKEAASAKTEAPQGAKSEAISEPITKKPSAQSDSAQVTTEAEQKAEEPQTDKDPKLKSVPGGQALGMSILGNEETPTSLVIVPWKSSEVGRATGISPMLDDSRQPVDKEVFMRELRYYEIRSEKKP
jgi:hypothetical protein